VVTFLARAGPSATPPFFEHWRTHPPWLLKERSLLIRQALDIVQEVAFYKVLKAMAGGSYGGEGLADALALEIQTRGDWHQLYHEAQDKSGAERIRPGACVMKSVLVQAAAVSFASSHSSP
jgi:hypothetical protein